MPSLADIPERITDSSDPAVLLNWLTLLPITRATALQLAALWAQATGVHLDKNHWDKINLTFIR